jgi:hypothetical protein
MHRVNPGVSLFMKNDAYGGEMRISYKLVLFPFTFTGTMVSDY